MTVHVTPKPSNEKYEPTGGEITVEEGTPVSDEEITGKVTIPEGSNGTPSIIGERPNTNTPGNYPVEVEVTYPDGSKDTTTVTVHVTPKPSTSNRESKKGLTKALPKTGMYGEYDKLGFGFMGLYAALVLIKFNLKRKEDEELM
ncbi:LPXTG cell wall anchor domain-containing protein [Enterococcus cecorum]|nr:LPXTG cell wall anchor domain-containing protein [Enterococcus cecorum]